MNGASQIKFNSSNHAGCKKNLNNTNDLCDLLHLLAFNFHSFHYHSALMNNTYTDLVKQTFDFPQEGFSVNQDNYLEFNGVDMKRLIDKYGTPFKLTYLPKIGMQINKSKKLFNDAIKKHRYDGKYYYCYCTKSSHFSFIVEETLKHDVHIETSFAYDIEIIKQLYKKEK